MAVLPTPGSPIRTGLFLVRPAQDLDHPFDLVLSPHQGIQAALNGQLGQIATEFRQQRSFLGPADHGLFRVGATQFLADRSQLQPSFMQYLRCQALVFAKNPQQQVFGSDMPVAQTFGLVGRKGEDSLAFRTQGKVDRCRHLLPNYGSSLDILLDGIDGRVRAQKAIGEALVLPHQAQEKVFGLDGGASELAGFVPSEKDHPSGFFGVSLKHEYR